MFRLPDLILLSAVILVCLYWLNAQRVKELVLWAAKAHCDKVGVQLLDEGVVLRRLWFKRDTKGNMRLWRRFQFEFSSTGDERYSGRVDVLGQRIQNFSLDPHRVP